MIESFHLKANGVKLRQKAQGELPIAHCQLFRRGTESLSCEIIGNDQLAMGNGLTRCHWPEGGITNNQEFTALHNDCHEARSNSSIFFQSSSVTTPASSFRSRMVIASALSRACSIIFSTGAW